MIRSIHRLSLSGVQPTSNPFGCGVTGVLQALCLWLVPAVLTLLIAGTSVRAQTVTTLYSYVDNAPPRRLVQGNNGNFYSIVGGGLLVMTPSGNVTVVTVIGDSSEGSSLVQGDDGDFYGTTEYGGSAGEGSVFKITAEGTLTTLHSFTGVNPEGSQPEARLVKGSDGNFYGTTYFGGVKSGGVSGTAFKITPGGTLTTLHSFTGSPDGANPIAPLIQASNGNLYGTTYNGGFSPLGTVFMVTAAGAETRLCPFTSYGPVGSSANPVGPVTQGSDGNLYGTTPYGGHYSDLSWSGGYGSVYRVTLGGTLTVLHWFQGTDGYGPVGGLVQASDGNLYGTTPYGGANGSGTIFKMTLGGTLTTVYSFTGGNDGGNPGSLLLANDGKFYVTTSYGGDWGLGAIVRFSIPPAPPTITVQPQVQTVVTNTTAIFTVTATGTAPLSYQWQVSADNGSNWGNLANAGAYSGVNLATLTVSTSSGLTGYQYRCLVSNSAGTATSNAATLTVNPATVAPSITSQPSNQTATAGQDAAFTVAASGTPARCRERQVSTDGGSNWNNLANDSTYSGVDSPMLTVTATITGQNGYRYRALATNTAGSASSSVAVAK